METIDILESRIKETLSRKARLEEERRNLVDEVMVLHENIRRLETEKEEIKVKLEAIIEKIELYLGRSEA
ncbi:MAG: hypothetical protein A2V51_04790 [Candidatus Dadabacteria bacterium RBG_19FT_COMBO_40_33]|jgi:predicted  nucleic acid-binding Zn-ribbon protein|nr:MAG: hypothetical protein A2V51_04790 [Candidatus Dadabacteria bacterium RBG_19FT_COMBO_40_33]